jgi:hypothetical protein
MDSKPSTCESHQSGTLRAEPSRDPALAEPDHEMFARLGIGPELLAAAGVCRVTDAEARELYGMQFDGNLAGLVFPYPNPETGDRWTARVRRDSPEIDPQGKSKNKYISAYGDNRHLYFPPGAGALLLSDTTDVVIVESEKAALAITALAARNGRRIVAVATRVLGMERQNWHRDWGSRQSP